MPGPVEAAIRALDARGGRRSDRFETGLRLSLSAIGGYLRSWGFTAQRPVRRATERSETEIKAWLDHEYPAIAKRAKQEVAEIQWRIASRRNVTGAVVLVT